MLTKEIFTPKDADRFLYNLAPFMVIIASFLTFACIPFNKGAEILNFNVGVFFLLAASSIGVVGILLAGWGSNNKFSLIGAMRSGAQIISYDKINQLRHVQYFQTPENILSHMDRLAQELRPKFDLVLSKLENQFGGTGLASWSTPKGGYFISLYTPPGCAKRTVALAKEAGVTLTDAGATYPYGKDEADRNIRIAPSYPTLEELDAAMDIFILCIKIAALENK